MVRTLYNVTMWGCWHLVRMLTSDSSILIFEFRGFLMICGSESRGRQLENGPCLEGAFLSGSGSKAGGGAP